VSFEWPWVNLCDLPKYSMTRSVVRSLSATAQLLVLPRTLYYRAMGTHSADSPVARCPSVRLSHACIVLKWLNMSSNFSPSSSHILDFFRTKPCGNIQTATRNGCVEWWWGMKNCDYRPISRFISDDTKSQ